MSPEYISLVANLFTAPLHIEASASYQGAEGREDAFGMNLLTYNNGHRLSNFNGNSHSKQRSQRAKGQQNVERKGRRACERAKGKTSVRASEKSD